MKLGFLASTLAIVSLAATPAIADSVFERKTAPTERENKIGAAAGIGLAVAAAAGSRAPLAFTRASNPVLLVSEWALP